LPAYAVEPPDPSRRVRLKHAKYPHADFTEGKGAQSAPQRQPIRKARADQAANTQPEQKRAHNYCGGDRVRSRERAEHALPSGLVGECAKAGKEEKTKEQYEHRTQSLPNSSNRSRQPIFQFNAH